MNKKLIPYLTIFLIFILSSLAYIYGKKSAGTTVDFHNDRYAGAETCKECHQEQYDSWKKTYHKSMTQEATEHSVKGSFDGSDQTYWGLTIRPIKRNGKFYFEYINPTNGALLNTLEITRTVGSRRYQQYLAQTENTEENYYRLEILWHINDQRWVHLNGAFLGHDNQSFDNHIAVWNQNCIFCHNTGVKPNMTNYDEIVKKTQRGEKLNLKIDSRFQSHVSDLGIGCESCHANGEEHITLNQNPIRKFYLNLTGDDDKSIVNPSKLSAKKSMDICGQCHGQRTPKTYELARKWMEQGPTYRPGDELQSHVNPVMQESTLNTSPSDMFKLRFWEDGTPRLSAYEYQGLSMSQCHTKGNLTCNDCHSMHEGNPKGMITKENLSNEACYSCHKSYQENLIQHTGHKLNSDGALCYNCHMPKIVYGVMEFHRSHKIESPNPKIEFQINKPNACSACHINKSDTWIISETERIWPKNIKTSEYQVKHIVQTIYKLHSGDPVERAIVAKNLSYQSILIPNQEKKYLIPHLIFAMEDNYPAIRRFSFKTLNAILKGLSIETNEFTNIQATLEAFDFIADINVRSDILLKVWQDYYGIDKSGWQTPPINSLLDNDYILDIQALIKLKNNSNQQEKQIQIGE